jgi:cob(I)alamin adenosyltransferase
MKIYTRKGDAGTTSLIGGTQVAKFHYRIAAYGSTDELNAQVGAVRDAIEDSQIRDFLYTIQNNLFIIGSILASDGRNQMKLPEIGENDVEVLEKEIDQIEQQLPALRNFILPGGHSLISHCHIARTVCRRAERKTVQLNENERVNPMIITYLNRLSDYFFVLARLMAQKLGVKEVTWKGSGS